MTTNGEAWRERATRDAVLSGDAEALRRWYDAHFARLAAYARWRCCGLRDLADDVIQETWLTAVRRLARFDPDRGAFFDWLCGIAANAARNAVRARRRHTAKVRALVPADDAPAPEAPATTDSAERVAASLAELPDHYERALRAKYLDGETVAEIAARTGAGEKAVESQLTRARQAFREAYERTP